MSSEQSERTATCDLELGLRTDTRPAWLAEVSVAQVNETRGEFRNSDMEVAGGRGTQEV